MNQWSNHSESQNESHNESNDESQGDSKKSMSDNYNCKPDTSRFVTKHKSTITISPDSPIVKYNYNQYGDGDINDINQMNAINGINSINSINSMNSMKDINDMNIIHNTSDFDSVSNITSASNLSEKHLSISIVSPSERLKTGSNSKSHFPSCFILDDNFPITYCNQEAFNVFDKIFNIYRRYIDDFGINTINISSDQRTRLAKKIEILRNEKSKYEKENKENNKEKEEKEEKEDKEREKAKLVVIDDLSYLSQLQSFYDDAAYEVWSLMRHVFLRFLESPVYKRYKHESGHDPADSLCNTIFTPGKPPKQSKGQMIIKL